MREEADAQGRGSSERPTFPLEYDPGTARLPAPLPLKLWSMESSKGSEGTAGLGRRDATLTGENVRRVNRLPLWNARDASNSARYTGSHAVGCCKIASRSCRRTTLPKLCIVKRETQNPTQVRQAALE